MAMNRSGTRQVQRAQPQGRRLHGLLAATLLLASCSETSVPQTTTPTASATASPPSDRATPTPDQSQQAIDADLTGVLGGSPSLASGCTWLVDEAGQRWEVLWPEGYQTSFRGELTVLTGPDGATIGSTGDRLGVNGAEPADLGSFCMVGRIFHSSHVFVIQALDELLDCRHTDAMLCRGTATWALREVGQHTSVVSVEVDEEPACPGPSDCAPAESQHRAGVIVTLVDGSKVLFNLVDSSGQAQLVPAGTD